MSAKVLHDEESIGARDFVGLAEAAPVPSVDGGVRKGWTCPSCGANLSPDVKSCGCSKPVTEGGVHGKGKILLEDN